MTDRLAGRRALVTGGAHGLGQAIVRAFVAEGARVAIGDIDAEAGRALAAELGDAALFVPLDVGSEEQWAAAVDTTVAAFDGLDIGVNNGGIVVHASLAEMTLEQYERIVRVNQIGTFLGLRTMAEPMKAGGRGSIVNISSIRGMVGSAGLLGYTATKFAVRGMTKAAALELGEFGIRVNALAPGFTMTDSNLGQGGDKSDLCAHTRSRQCLSDRNELSDDLAGPAFFLASPDSDFMTGQTLLVDGGLSMH